jgi:hypothetical protein
MPRIAAVIPVVRALVISLALLAAQHSALAHQLWHSAAQSALLMAAGDSDQQDHGNELLCDLHAALSTVVGGVDSAYAAAPLPDFAAEAFAAVVSSPPWIAGPLPSARDPPPLL